MLLIRRSQVASVCGIRAFHTSGSRKFSLLKNLQNNTDSEQSFVVKRVMNHPPDLFYDVVSDVSQYSKFVPYCTRSFINSRDKVGEPSEAGLRVGWRSFDEEFVCNLQCDPKKIVIAESVTHSLFKHLYTKWTITPNARKNSCDMELLLKFNFKSSLYNRVSSLFAESVSELVIRAFDKRATELRRETMRQERAKNEI